MCEGQFGSVSMRNIIILVRLSARGNQQSVSMRRIAILVLLYSRGVRGVI